jgi:ATP-dependent DNA ligase
VYSRTGKPYPEQSQISAELLPMMLAAPKLAPGTFGLPEGAKMEQDRRILAAYGAVPGGEGPMPYFAGELFSFGKSLNWISGQSRRKKGDGSLQYHIFDVFFPYAKAAGHDMASRDRQAYIDAFFANADALGLPHPHVVRVANYPVRSMAELNARAKEFVREGFEGAIARKDWAGYRYSYSGYHAPNALKIKPVHDDEFPVVGYTQGRRGKDVGAIVWICEVPKPVDPRDKTFNVVPKEMTYDMRYKLFKCLGELVEGPGGKKTRFEHFVKGLPLTVEYAEISTKTGKPLQAKALAFRTYEAGPEHDPFRKVLKDCGAL